MITLWPASPDDEAQIMEWRNDPFVYNAGFSERPVTAEEHKSWFSGQLEPGQREIFIINLNDDPIGMIRYEFSEDVRGFKISIFISAAYAGHGYGADAIRQCCLEITRRWPASRIVAVIKPENLRSVGAFRKSGFHIAGFKDTYLDNILMEYVA